MESVRGLEFVGEIKMGKLKPEEPLDGYKEITKQELAELRKMSAKESLTRGLKLIDDIEYLSKALNNGRNN
jgi:hypothetical protein